MDVPVDNQTLMRRPADGEKSIPMTDGSQAAGPKTVIRPKEGSVDPEAVPLLHKTTPPSELPEWSDGEVMPLIIIEHNSGVVIPRTTDRRVPVGSDILLPQSLEMNNSEDQGVLSAPMSPNRVRKGHSQDMPAEGSICVAGHPGIPHATGRGRGTSSRYYPAPAVELRRLQQPILRSTNCVCSVSEYLGDGYNDDCAHL